MAELLLTEGTIDEQFLKCLPLQKAREDIGVSLLANSSVHLAMLLIKLNFIFFSGHARSLPVLWGIRTQFYPSRM